MTIALPQFQPCANRETPEKPLRRVVDLTWGWESDWDQYVLEHADARIFHTLAWRNSVRRAFGHAEQYLMAVREGRVAGVLPMCVVRRPLLGAMLVSVPYGVGGGILANDAETAAALFAEARRRAMHHRCVLIDLRSEKAGVSGLPIDAKYVGFQRELPATVDEVAAWLPRKARAVVRNAHNRFGLTCEFDSRCLRTVWGLYASNMRRLGSINYPYRFFEAIAGEFADRCWVCLVRHKNEPVAGLLTLLFRDRVMPYFFGCAPGARQCGAANFIYSMVMEKAVAGGLRVFDFGRSRKDNAGSCDFKRFHGFEARPLHYQRCVLAGSKPVELTPSSPGLGLARRIWPRLPLAITRPAGSFLSHYIPG